MRQVQSLPKETSIIDLKDRPDYFVIPISNKVLIFLRSSEQPGVSPLRRF